MKVYVVYWVDLDDDCLKKSEIKIIGVYSNLEQAKITREEYDHTGYCYNDERCYYCNICKIELDKVYFDLEKIINEYNTKLEQESNEHGLITEDYSIDYGSDGEMI